MSKFNRRNFIKATGLGVASSLLLPEKVISLSGLNLGKNQRIPFSLGMASYSFREFTLNEAVTMTKRLGLKRIALKSMHLPLESAESEIKETADFVRQAGLDLYGCGVVYMKSEDEVQRAFQYAQAAGMKIIIGVPNHELLPLVSKKTAEFDIKVAIHNHGPGDELYPTPQSAYERIQDLDPRLGLCLDIGHTQRSGIDPAQAALRLSDRLLDVHIKDVTASSRKGGPIEMGRGVIDLVKFIRVLIELDYRGTASFEYEKDGKDPLAGAAESVGFVRGVIAAL